MGKHTIKIKKYADVIEEYPAASAITPGMLIEVFEDSGVRKVKPCTATTGKVLPMFALEDELQGRGIDVNYAEGDRVQCWLPGRGDMVYAILADGQDISVGNWLESVGDGTLKILSSGDHIGQAVEAVDMSGSTGEDPDGRIIVRIN